MSQTHAVVRTLMGVAVLLLAAPGPVLAQAAPGARPAAQATVVTKPARPAVVVQQPSTPPAGAPTPAPRATPAAALPTPKLTFTPPHAANLGDDVTMEATLVAPSGAPIAGATIAFTSGETFLNATGSLPVAQAVTDKQGVASAAWQPRVSGQSQLTVSFAGNKQYKAAKTTSTVDVSGDRQLYDQEAGVRIPGLNTAPIPQLAGAWPKLSAWPLVLTLLIVWSLYGRAVALLFRIARGPGAAAFELPTSPSAYFIPSSPDDTAGDSATGGSAVHAAADGVREDPAPRAVSWAPTKRLGPGTAPITPEVA